MAAGDYRGSRIEPLVWFDESSELSPRLVEELNQAYSRLSRSMRNTRIVVLNESLITSFVKSVNDFKCLVDKEVTKDDNRKFKDLVRRYNLAKVKRDRVLMTDLEKQIVVLRVRMKS